MSPELDPASFLRSLPLRALQIALIIPLVALWTGCAKERPSAQLRRLFEEEWEKRLSDYPEFATYLGDRRYNDRLTDRSLEGIARRHEEAVEIRDRLVKIRTKRVTDADRLNYDLFLKELETGIEGDKFSGYLMAIDQMSGIQLDFPNLVDVTPLRNTGDYDAYLQRLVAFPAMADQVIALLMEGVRTGMTQPAVILRSVPEQIRSQCEIAAEQSPLYRPFANFPKDFPDTLKGAYAERGRLAVEQSVIPAYRTLLGYVEGEYLPAARQEIACRSLPNGEEYYRYLVRTHTTTDLTPEEIHEIGMKEVDRIMAEMDSVVRSVEFKGSFDDFLKFLRDDPRFYYTSGEDLLNGYRAICKKVDPELAKLFGKLPRIPYGVVPIPDYQAPASTTAYYNGPAADGSRPGLYYANTYKLEERPKYEMEALSLHEAVPGHHLQIALATELEGVPDFRKHGGFTSFVEGWGLYAESLGEEMGFYTDPYSKFGQLTYEMWRACRLVVDTGMHFLGWTREEAIGFMKANTAKTEHDIVVEIDRYIAWPGQALAYKIGELKIQELRRKAKEALGENFDIRAFHDAVLENGAVPLTVLEEKIGEFIREEKSRG